MTEQFPPEVVKAAWDRAGGKCECERIICGHVGKHNKELDWESRGNDKAKGCWEAHHIDANAPPVLSNCEILCCPCHKNTKTYGR